MGLPFSFCKKIRLADQIEMQSTLMALPAQITSLLSQRLALLRIVNFVNMDDVDTLDEPISDSDPESRALYIKGSIGWAAPRLIEQQDISDADASPDREFTLRDLDITFPKGEITLIAGKFGSGKTLALLGLLGEAKLLEGEISYATSENDSSHLLPLDIERTSNFDWRIQSSGVAYCPQIAWLQSQSIR